MDRKEPLAAEQTTSGRLIIDAAGPANGSRTLGQYTAPSVVPGAFDQIECPPIRADSVVCASQASNVLR